MDRKPNIHAGLRDIAGPTVYLGTNAVVSLFTDESAYAKVARRAVLAVSERAPVLSAVIKGAIRRQLTGNGAAIAMGQ